jgi:hypothetical protein
MYSGLRIKRPIVLPDINQICNFSTDFHKVPNTIIQGNPFSWCRADTADRRTHMAKVKALSRPCERAKQRVFKYPRNQSGQRYSAVIKHRIYRQTGPQWPGESTRANVSDSEQKKTCMRYCDVCVCARACSAPTCRN